MAKELQQPQLFHSPRNAECYFIKQRSAWEAAWINDAHLIKEVNNCSDVPWTRGKIYNAAGNKKSGVLIKLHF